MKILNFDLHLSQKPLIYPDRRTYEHPVAFVAFHILTYLHHVELAPLRIRTNESSDASIAPF